MKKALCRLLILLFISQTVAECFGGNIPSEEKNEKNSYSYLEKRIDFLDKKFLELQKNADDLNRRRVKLTLFFNASMLHSGNHNENLNHYSSNLDGTRFYNASVKTSAIKFFVDLNEKMFLRVKINSTEKNRNFKFRVFFIRYAFDENSAMEIGGDYLPLSIAMDSAADSSVFPFLLESELSGSYIKKQGVGGRMMHWWKNFGLVYGIFGNDINEDIKKTSSVSFASKFYHVSFREKNNFLHYGFEYLYSKKKYDEENAQSQELPSAGGRFVPFFSFSNVRRLNFEFITNYRSLNFTSEISKTWLTPSRFANKFGKSFSVNNFYLQTSYFLTGEERMYSEGLTKKYKVNHPVNEGGIGSIELGARFSRSDNRDSLGNGTANGLRMDYLKWTECAAIASWLPTDATKFSFLVTKNFVRYDNPNLLRSVGDRGKTNFYNTELSFRIFM
ncbi:MAG: hypothetical protein LBB09_03420 [Rickettsiales bacterium]|nr:hypothetical protein [Rickettsiales bacterium]